MPGRVYEHAFWSRPDVREWIEAFGTSTRPVTIFVGAGSSMEIGLPSWTELLRSILNQVGGDMGLGASTARDSSFASAILASEGVVAAAEVARAYLGVEFEPTVIDSIYADRPTPLPGPTAKAVARLYRALEGRCEIATLNYDLLLEQALVDAGDYDVNKVSAVADGQEHPESVVVRHLHGARGPRGAQNPFGDVGTLVLSERDYLLPDGQWQEAWVLQRLIHSRCIFIGIGMSDLNILRYLYRSERLRGCRVCLCSAITVYS